MSLKFSIFTFWVFWIAVKFDFVRYVTLHRSLQSWVLGIRFMLDFLGTCFCEFREFSQVFASFREFSGVFASFREFSRVLRVFVSFDRFWALNTIWRISGIQFL